MDENQLRDELKNYGFYHIIKLTENLSTPGFEDYIPIQEVPLRALRSLDIKNKRVLDIGCRDGLFCFEAEKYEAQEVIGIDNDLSLGAVNLLIPYLKSKVKMHQLNVFDLKPETFGMFEIVIFPGVLYHLRYPFWALKLIKDVLNEGGKLIIETAVFMDENKRAILYCPTESDGLYEDATSCTFFNMKGLIDTLYSLDLVTQETELLYTKQWATNKNLLAIIKSRVKALMPVKPYVDRVTLVCCKQTKTETTLLNQYWNGTHKFHSQPLR